MSRRIAEKDAYEIVPETCPVVDAAIEKAVDAIKEQTSNLREALICMIVERNNLQDQLDDAMAKIKELENDLQKVYDIIEDKN
jgi:DNA-binding transcriptional regulator GbsR (MarR family)